MLAWLFLAFANIQAPFFKNGMTILLTRRHPLNIPDIYDEFYRLRVKFVTQKIISSMTCFCKNGMSS
jgi:hypothetical protein